jgi:hypothetical protein
MGRRRIAVEFHRAIHEPPFATHTQFAAVYAHRRGSSAGADAHELHSLESLAYSWNNLWENASFAERLAAQERRERASL